MSDVSTWPGITERRATRAALARTLRVSAPDCQPALRFIVADLLASDYPPDVLLTVADALREAAKELQFDSASMRAEVHSLHVLADVLAEDAPLHRGGR